MRKGSYNPACRGTYIHFSGYGKANTCGRSNKNSTGIGREPSPADTGFCAFKGSVQFNNQTKRLT
jgi:hypothetical protein